jgi:NAD dependent epimerase/dehydratase family
MRRPHRSTVTGGICQTAESAAGPISPYAVSKLAGEQYAYVWRRLDGAETLGRQYFNVFRLRQHPVLSTPRSSPTFILWALQGRPFEVHGGGRQSRDFTYMDKSSTPTCASRFPPAEAMSVQRRLQRTDQPPGDHRAPGRNSRPTARPLAHASPAGDIPRVWPMSPRPSGYSATRRPWASTTAWRGRSSDPLERGEFVSDFTEAGMPNGR